MEVSPRTVCQQKIKSFIREISDIDVEKLERSIYNKVITISKNRGIVKNWKNKPFLELYNDISRQVLLNLDPESHVCNTGLLDSIKQNPENIIKIVDMNAEQMYPERWKNDIEEKKIREQVLTQRKKMDISFMKCGKCKKSDNLTVTTVQMRSADEGSTNIIVCGNCNHTWKS